MRHWRIVIPVAILPITVVEVDPFPSRADPVWKEAERLEFIEFISRNPLAGDIIPGSGGARKARWTREGKGKRGGVRVVYYYYDASIPLFLLTVYAKSRKDDLTLKERRAIRKLIAELRSSYGKG